MSNGAIGRRSLLAASAVGLGMAGLASCSSDKKTTEGAKKSAELKLPTYKAVEGPKPDLPGDERGLMPAYLAVPSQLTQSVKTPPITSGSVTCLTQTFNTPPPAMKDNPFWQRLNKAMGGEFKATVVVDDYPSKYATVLASGDLPDLMWLPPNQGIPNVGPMLESQFTDLTKYLSGDAVLQWPNLAGLKPHAWRTAVVNGKIWGPPVGNTLYGQVYIGNPEIWKQVGGFNATSAEDFLAKCKELTKPGKRYALEPFLPNAFHMFGEWFGVPNGYRVNKDRTLSASFQTDQYLEALEYAQKVWNAKVFYPDQELAQSENLFANGTLTALVASQPADAPKYRTMGAPWVGEVLMPFGAVKGRKPVYDLGLGSIGFTPFKKTTDEKKIHELLDIMNYLSAPFGTVEFMQKNWGAKGEDYVEANGAYEYTKSGKVNVPGLRSALNIMSGPEPVLNYSNPEDTKYVYEVQKKLLDIAMPRTSSGLYSDTASSKGGKLGQKINDTRDDVIKGRKTIDDFKKAVKEWESGGGKKILEEYAAALPKDFPITPDPNS